MTREKVTGLIARCIGKPTSCMAAHLGLNLYLSLEESLLDREIFCESVKPQSIFLTKPYLCKTVTSAFLKELILDYRKLSSSHHFNFRFLSLLVIYETFEEKLCRRRRAKWSGSRNCVGFSRGQVKNFLFSTPAKYKFCQN